jgi:WD40 repeat protein
VLLRKFEGLRGMDFSSGFSGDGRLFAVGSTGARIYDAKTWEQVLEINDLGSPIMDLALSPNGKRIAIATAGRLLVVRDVASGELIKAWTDFQGRPTAICWVTNEVLVAAGPGDGGFRVLKAASKGKPGDSALGGTGIFVPSPRGNDIKALALLPSGQVVAAGAGGFIHIWDQVR